MYSDDQMTQIVDMKMQQVLYQRTFTKLRNTRIVRFDLVYVSGIPREMATEKILLSDQFLGQYGKINQISISKWIQKSKKKDVPKTLSCHVIYSSIQEATAAVLALNGYTVNGKKLIAAYGFTRYCLFFLQNQACQNENCLYTHNFVEQKLCFDKRETNQQGEINSLIRKNLCKNLLQFKESKIKPKNTNYAIFRDFDEVKNIIKVLQNFVNIFQQNDDIFEFIQQLFNLSTSQQQQKNDQKHYSKQSVNCDVLQSQCRNDNVQTAKKTVHIQVAKRKIEDLHQMISKKMGVAENKQQSNPCGGILQKINFQQFQFQSINSVFQ